MELRTLALAATLAALGCSTALAAPATVNLRVEGETRTIFEGRVTTDGHAIKQDGSGPHPCDGTNAGANPAPGPTITSALDDAIAWDGRWSDGLQDFLVSRIGPDANDVMANQFWGHALNYQASQLGGCQQQVRSGDEVLFAYDFFSAACGRGGASACGLWTARPATRWRGRVCCRGSRTSAASRARG